MFRFWLIAGALSMLAAIVMATVAAHGLELTPELRVTFASAREMHLTHALALTAVGIVTAQFGRSLFVELAGAAFLLGTLLFPGGIYLAYAANITDVRPLIPVGGMSFMAGWVLFAAGATMLKART